MPDVKSILSRNIRILRKASGLSQMQLAEKCEVSNTFIQQIEAARQFPSSRNFERIADVLGVEPYQLILDPSKKEIPPDEKHIALWMLDDLEKGLQEDVKQRFRTLRESF